MDDQQQRRQEHFNKAYLGVIAQGALAYRREEGNNYCMYLTDEGHKCNVGQILSPDDLAKVRDFMGDVGHLWREFFPKNQNHHLHTDQGFYLALQGVHDDCTHETSDQIEAYRGAMIHFAQTWNLEMPDETATA